LIIWQVILKYIMPIKTFKCKEIDSIFSKVKKDAAYFQKYEKLDSYKDGIIDEWLVGHDYPRVPCILDFKEWIAKYNIKPKKLLSTDMSDFELKYISYDRLSYLPYDHISEQGDLHTIDLVEKDYDFILFSQTLEHLYNPLLAVKNLFNHTSPGGYVFTSVPTINIPHMTPCHFQGIYPMGLATLFMSVGFELIEIGQWGNIYYLEYLFSKHEWPDYNYLINKGNGKILNEERNVAQCWCLVRKL